MALCSKGHFWWCLGSHVKNLGWKRGWLVATQAYPLLLQSVCIFFIQFSRIPKFKYRTFFNFFVETGIEKSEVCTNISFHPDETLGEHTLLHPAEMVTCNTPCKINEQSHWHQVLSFLLYFWSTSSLTICQSFTPISINSNSKAKAIFILVPLHFLMFETEFFI